MLKHQKRVFVGFKSALKCPFVPEKASRGAIGFGGSLVARHNPGVFWRLRGLRVAFRVKLVHTRHVLTRILEAASWRQVARR